MPVAIPLLLCKFSKRILIVDINDKGRSKLPTSRSIYQIVITVGCSRKHNTHNLNPFTNLLNLADTGFNLWSVQTNQGNNDSSILSKECRGVKQTLLSIKSIEKLFSI